MPAPPVFRPARRPPLRPRRYDAIPAVGGLPLPPAEIPYSWLARPLRSRPDKPITSAAVSQSGGTSAYKVDDDSLAEYGDNPFSATLYTATNADPANLADWTLNYYATQPGAVPRTRFSSLPVCLSKRTVAEQQYLLDIGIGRRIKIINIPPTWPAGKADQVVEGIRDSIGTLRMREFITAPVVGTTAGTAGPWFRAGSSSVGGTDVMPF